MSEVDLLALAERVEASAGADRELDAEIRLAVLGDCPYGAIVGNRYQVIGTGTLSGYVEAFREVLTDDDALHDDVVPRYTVSIDAAVTLVPDGWGWAYLDKSAIVRLAGSMEHGMAEAANPARSIVSAALRARHQSAAGEGE